MNFVQSLPFKFGRRVTATVAAIAMASGLGVVAFVAAPAANAHTPSVSATCSVLSVDLQNYRDPVPGKDAVPGTPGQPYVAPTYETVVVTPAVPAVPAVPATYVQEWLYVQHETGKQKWMPEGWNGIVKGQDHGQGWHYVQPIQHRDTETVLTPAIPAVAAIPAVTKQVQTSPGQPYVAPTSGTPAVPAKVNTVKVTIDGKSVEDTTFGKSFVRTFDFSDKTVAHTWQVQVVAWDDARFNVNQSGTTTPCVAPVGVTLPQPEVTQAHGVCTDGVFTTSEATVKLLARDHVTWGDYGQDENGVIHDVKPGTYTYEATTDSGYTLEPTSVTVKVETPVGNECPPPMAVIHTVTAPPAANPATCEADGTLPTLPTNDDYTFTWDRSFDGPGTYTATAKANAGHYFEEGVKTSFEIVVPAQLGGHQCEPSVVIIDVQPAAPTFHDVCGTADDATTVPGDTQDFTYSKVVEGATTTVTVTSANKHAKFAEGIVTSWTHVFTSEACPTSTPTPTKTPTATPTTSITSTPAATKTAVVIPQGTTPPTQAAAVNNQWTPDLAAQGGSSASTDANPIGLIAIATALLVLVGLVLRLSPTRRRSRRH